MSAATTLQAQKRTETGTGAARATRKAGFVPGIIYGDNKEPQMIAVDPKVLAKECQSSGFFSRVFDITLDGKTQQTVAKDVHLHPVTDEPMHVDFQRVNKDSKIHVSIPINFINEDKAPGIKRGGMLNIIFHTLEVICPVQSIPERLTVDLTGADSNHSILIAALNLPKGVVAAHPERDNTIATIVAPSSGDEEKEEAA